MAKPYRISNIYNAFKDMIFLNSRDFEASVKFSQKFIISNSNFKFKVDSEIFTKTSKIQY